jgi:hypothetical protein
MKRLLPDKPPPELYILDDAAIAEIPQKLKAIAGFLDSWAEYVDHRQEHIPKNRSKPIPLTPRAAKMGLRGLERTPDPIRCIERSIERGWEGLCSDIPFADAAINVNIQNKGTGLVL